MLDRRSVFFVAASAVFAMGCANAGAVTFSASGANAAAIQATVDAYRLALGTLNPNVAGSFGSGRREINWDGVPDALAAPNALPANFFNVNSPRGVVFTTGGTGFEVSANSGLPTPVRFGDINAAYPNIFQTFSAQRLFTDLGSNVMDVNFFVAGSATAALTAGFGAVFTDVDLSSTTSIQFFDTNNVSLGTFFATPSNAGLSFLGVQFNAGEKVGRVRITTGNAAIGGNDTSVNDVVVMDDFIYGEAIAATPEPGTMMLLSAGLGVIVLAARRRSGSA